MKTYTIMWLLFRIVAILVRAFPAYSFVSSYGHSMILQLTKPPSLSRPFHPHDLSWITLRKRRNDTTTRRITSTLLTFSSSMMMTTTTTVGYVYMCLLALQFATQPILTQKFAPKTIVKSTYVLAQEMVRLVIATLLLVMTGSWTTATAGWSWSMCLTTVGIPAILYILQNKFSFTAYQHLSPIAFNVWNQSKTLSAAFFCYIVLGQSQSPIQMGALALLFAAVWVMEVDLSSWFSTSSQATNIATTTPKQRRDYYLLGVLPVLLASAISGLAGALAQRTLQTRDSLLFSVELAVISIVLLVVDLCVRKRPRQQPSQPSWTTGWSLSTWIPVITNALGGILVGLVTKHAGAVRKGFALILGMFLSGALQNQLLLLSADDNDSQKEQRVSLQQWMGGLLASISLWLHSYSPVQ